MPTKEIQMKYDVIIAGAGPVGLFLACELALAKCSVLILEKETDPQSPLKKVPFGIRGLSSLSVEHLDRRGLLEELELHKRLKNPHQNSGQGPRRQGGHFAGIPLLDGNIDASQWRYRLDSSTEPSLISEMQELETVFSRRAKILGVEIKRGYGVSDFSQTDDEVIVYANETSFKGRWLIGCDGARSVIRKRGGFEFAGTEPEFTGYSTSVEITDSSMLKSGRNVTEFGMYMQSQPGYVIMQDFDGGAFHSSGKPITLEHVQDVLRRISNTDVTIKALHLATTWTDRARQVTSYRNARVLLAGDAAHIHAPLGGQGLNLGLGDAMNLGWKLASTIQGNAPAGLLDSYQAERQPIGEQILEWSRAQVAIMRPTPQGRALNAIIRDLINTRDGATYFAGRIWGIGTHYELNGTHALVGHSVPNFELISGFTIGHILRDGRGILLDFIGQKSLAELATEYGPNLKYISEPSKEQLGLTALLIRPDGIIAWAMDGEIDVPSARRALATWFV